MLWVPGHYGDKEPVTDGPLELKVSTRGRSSTFKGLQETVLSLIRREERTPTTPRLRGLGESESQAMGKNTTQHSTAGGLGQVLATVPA